MAPAYGYPVNETRALPPGRTLRRSWPNQAAEEETRPRSDPPVKRPPPAGRKRAARPRSAAGRGGRRAPPQDRQDRPASGRATVIGIGVMVAAIFLFRPVREIPGPRRSTPAPSSPPRLRAAGRDRPGVSPPRLWDPRPAHLFGGAALQRPVQRGGGAMARGRGPGHRRALAELASGFPARRSQPQPSQRGSGHRLGPPQGLRWRRRAEGIRRGYAAPAPRAPTALRPAEPARETSSADPLRPTSRLIPRGCRRARPGRLPGGRRRGRR